MAHNGAAEGTVVIANEQSNGKGRRGKSFASPPGTGLYFSFLVRPSIPAKKSVLITPAIAVCVSKTIEDVSGKCAMIKWVNDIYIENKKVCGILTESSFSSENLDYAVIGIGINIAKSELYFPKDVRSVAGCILNDDENAEKKKKKAQLVSGILKKFFDIYKDIEQETFLDEYRQRSLILGKMVCVNKGNDVIRGVAQEIDNDVRLKVKLENGSLMLFNSGEVSIKF
jgi:BirA family biotin operon repressor/biotin-[acetyl-CoA-carboxylase] ligase